MNSTMLHGDDYLTNRAPSHEKAEDVANVRDQQLVLVENVSKELLRVE